MVYFVITKSVIIEASMKKIIVGLVVMIALSGCQYLSKDNSGQIADMVSQIDLLRADVNHLKDDVEGKAETTALETTQTDAQDALDGVDQNTSDITDLQSKVSDLEDSINSLKRNSY